MRRLIASIVSVDYQVIFGKDIITRYPSRFPELKSGLLRDLTTIPPEATMLWLSQVAIVKFEPNMKGTEHSYCHERTAGAYEQTFRIAHNADDAAKLWKQYAEVHVHPSLKGKVWIFGAERDAAEQNTAAQAMPLAA